MIKRASFVLSFVASACVTVNIYFPAAAVERAADQIVKETWGSPKSPEKKEEPRSQISRLKALVLRVGADEAYAQETDINVSNPAIRALKASIKKRADVIKPFMDRGNIGITRDGLLAVRTTEGLSLKERAEVRQLVEAENRDRESLYVEIAKANNIAQQEVPRIKRIFARSWIEQAKPGWWIQDDQGNWKKK
ncbi:MAG TPA: YdbL family protein [Terriglobales bacterium]|jgi:uncharacterized protein YdbL (DUF1318 family)|nr:YdbL family protein [Terriglobales bacterium]